jgi:hypothetical protein
VRTTVLAAAGGAIAVLAIATGFAVRPEPGGDGFILLVAPPFVAVGALLAARRPANPIGWLFLAFGVLACVGFASGQYAQRALSDDPGSLPGEDVAAVLALHLWHPLFGFVVLSLLLFPDGRFLSPGWGWFGRLCIAYYAALVLVGPFDQEEPPVQYSGVEPLFHGPVADALAAVFPFLLTLNLLVLPIAGASLLARLRRTRGDARQQVKAFVYAVAFVMFTFPLSILVFGGGAYGVFLLGLIPVSAAVAILKYRLYDIDVVINRTLVYGALTAALAGTYLGLVLLTGLAVGRSGFAVAVSTLAVAALFRPLRVRIQGLVDRRFYRRRYDAALTLEAFGTRLRDELDLEALAADVRGVVRDTVQPAHVSLWLRSAR